MTEPKTAEPPLPQCDSEDDAATRGTLTVREKVAQRLAVRAALDTPDVLPFSAGLTKIAGRSLPQAQLTVTDSRVTAHLKVTV
ncbi:MAG: hypothetical protein P4L86_30885, partial [Mycobacterium sp.]|nr:hypothetical protein [Mycobacterium sp.]